MRYLIPSLALGLAAAPALAQPSPPVKKLTATPAAEARPALRYELLPTYRDRTPGNAALDYFRAFAALPAPTGQNAAANEAALARWEDTPIDRLPVAEVKKHLASYAGMFRELDKAAACERCDWEMTQRIKADGIGVLLTEVQPSREVMRYLALRTRVELAENRFDDAARSLRTALQMARHVGEAPTLIQLLVGLTLEATALERVDEWVGRPGSPNLYWALSGLPRPLIDPRPAFQGEDLFADTIFPGLRELERGTLPGERAAQLAGEWFKRAQGLTRDPDNPQPGLEQILTKLGAAGYVTLHYPGAKKELLARGRTAKEVDALPPAQVVFLNSLERAREMRDDQWKWLGMPYDRAYPALKAAEERRKKLLADEKSDVVLQLFALVLPATGKVMLAAARAERKVAALRAIEAVRLHAAAHGGRAPAKLDEITAVPVPNDPITGKPFEYTSRGDGFTLTGPPPAGEDANPSNSLAYDITLAAK